MSQVLLERHKPIIFTPYKIRNQIINEDKLGRDIDNFKPKDQLRVLQSYMSTYELKQRLIHKKEMMQMQTRQYLSNLANSHKSSRLNSGFNFHNPGFTALLKSGFNKTGLKAYYKFNEFYLPTATFTDDFASSSGWTKVGTAIDISGGQMVGTTVPNNAEHRMHKSLGVTLSNTVWTLDYDFNFSAINDSAGDTEGRVILSAGTNFNDDSLDAIGNRFLNEAPAHGKNIRIFTLDGGSLASSGATAFSLSTQYYNRLERISATLAKSTAFSDSSRSTPIANPITFTIASTVQGLDTIQFTSVNYGVSATWSGTFDNVAVYNSVNPVLKNYATDVGSGDSLGTAADGTLNGAISIVSGKIDNAYLFNGSDGYSELSASTTQWNFLHNSNAQTSIAFWMKAGSGGTGDKYILSDQDGGVTNDRGFRINRGASNVMNCVLHNGSAASIIISSASNFIPDETNWYFYLIRVDLSITTNSGKMRRNNGNEVTANRSAAGVDGDATQPMRIARGVGAGGSSYGNFSMDELSIWNRLLTADEETTLYNSGNGAVIT